ncbi:hypothetical protein DAI22_07g078700 [Oryza sativa Japonica Group]|nr:hypothetical protein DAI22_07g078700 [Oryza sativa Japonica Group]
MPLMHCHPFLHPAERHEKKIYNNSVLDQFNNLKSELPLPPKPTRLYMQAPRGWIEKTIW